MEEEIVISNGFKAVNVVIVQRNRATGAEGPAAVLGPLDGASVKMDDEHDVIIHIQPAGLRAGTFPAIELDEDNEGPCSPPDTDLEIAPPPVDGEVQLTGSNPSAGTAIQTIGGATGESGSQGSAGGGPTGSEPSGTNGEGDGSSSKSDTTTTSSNADDEGVDKSNSSQGEESETGA